MRRDLRLHDLPALTAAHDAGARGVLPVFVIDPRLVASGGQVRLAALASALRGAHAAYDGALVIRTGDPRTVIPALAKELGGASVHVSAETTPYARRRDEAVRSALASAGVDFVPTGTPYAVGPGTILTGGGSPYQVFTPFSRAWREHGWPLPASVPSGLRWVRRIESEELPDWAAPDVDLPECSEEAAHARWAQFLEGGLDDYDNLRDRADLDATSQLSMHLKYGTIHPRTLLADVSAQSSPRAKGPTRFVTEIAWREFYADVLWHRPDSAWADLKPALAGMAYDEPGEAFEAWKEGRTGYPFVDAGMRQLLRTGWMHNRLRMVTASFLVKDLHIWWPHGARHFMAHLRDGDLASNSHGWQWTAGSGTDASPYFRVFNPVGQGRKFDPDGEYVRRYVPELAHVPGDAVHEPWSYDGGYDNGYPERIVDHARERQVTLERYDAVRG